MRTEVPKGQAPLERGELQSAEELLPLVYDELRRLAAERCANGGSNGQIKRSATEGDHGQGGVRLTRTASRPGSRSGQGIEAVLGCRRAGRVTWRASNKVIAD